MINIHSQSTSYSNLDELELTSVKTFFGHSVPVYDDGFGSLYIHRDSMGISGVVKAQTWEDAYAICEDEFFCSADEEAFAAGWEEMSDHEQACWNESYGYRPNGQGGPTPKTDRGVYARDPNGDLLDLLTPQLADELQLTVVLTPCK